MGSYVLAAAAKSSGGFSPDELILILVVVVGFYMLMIRPQQKRKQKAMQQQSTVRPGARVRTTAGMYATVVAVDEESGDVVLEVAPGVEVRYMKRAVMDVISSGDEPEETDEPDETDDSYDEGEYEETEETEEGDEADESADGFHDDLGDDDLDENTADVTAESASSTKD